MIRIAALVTLAAAILATPAAAAVGLTGVDASRHPTMQLSVVTNQPSKAAPVVQENGHAVAGLVAQNLGTREERRGGHRPLAVDGGQAPRRRDRRQLARSSEERPPPTGSRWSHSERVRYRRLVSSSATIDTDSALRNLALDKKQGTALYDAIHLSSLALSTEANPGRVIVVMTDGSNVAKGVSLEKGDRRCTEGGCRRLRNRDRERRLLQGAARADRQGNRWRVLRSELLGRDSRRRTTRSLRTSRARGGSRT